MPQKSTLEIEFDSIPNSVWDRVSNFKFFFGHQSVGSNILDGVKSLIQENPNIKLKIVRTRDKADLSIGTFAHDWVGKNMDFQSKIDDFRNILNENLAEHVDIAFQKFCYLEFHHYTDPKKIFEPYRASITKLKEQHPNLKFIHTTVPLLAIQTGPKAWIKKIIGRPIDGIDDNVKRIEYNKMLKEAFPDDLFFDIAKAQSTFPDGSRNTFVKEGNTYYAMVPTYTNDGGHLNNYGSRQVAFELLKVLAKASTAN